MNRYFKSFPALVFLLILAGSDLWAERINTVGISAGIVASADDRPYLEGYLPPSDSDEYFLVGSFFPRINLSSRGPASLFSIYYGFGMNRVDSDLDLDSESHSVGLQWNTALGRRGTFSLSSNFRKSPDFDTFTLFSGIVETPDGYFFDFDTVALQRDSYWSSSSAVLGFDTGPHSKLNFSGGFSFRNYEDLAGFRQEDQVRSHAGIQFSKDISERASWNTGYQARYWEYYGGDSTSYSHNLDLGFKYLFSPTLSLNLSAGPSYILNSGTYREFEDKVGYNVGASLLKNIENHLFSLSYNERSGASYGIGGMVKSRDLSFAYSRSFNWVLLNASIRYFDMESLREGGYSPEGIYSTASIGFNLARSLLLEFGGSYRKQDDNESGMYDYVNFDRRRIFVAVRFNFPELWRIGG